MCPSLKISINLLLDSMKATFDGSAMRLVGAVGHWFAREFSDAHADDKLDILNCVRPTLRESGFDICDTELGEQVGCECCSGESEFSRYKGRIPSDDDRVTAQIWEFQPAINVKVMLSNSYEFGLNLDINYCPVCGRRLRG